MSEFRKSSQYTDPHNLIRKVLPWVHVAGNPYFDWVFGGTRIANQILCHWMGRPSSEISILKVQLLIYKNQIAGGFIALSGKELKKCRRIILKLREKYNEIYNILNPEPAISQSEQIAMNKVAQMHGEILAEIMEIEV